MIKPNALKKGYKIAIVSLSWGRLGDEKPIGIEYQIDLDSKTITIKESGVNI